MRSIAFSNRKPVNFDVSACKATKQSFSGDRLAGTFPGPGLLACRVAGALNTTIEEWTFLKVYLTSFFPGVDPGSFHAFSIFC